MTKPEAARKQMRRAIEQILRRKKLIICDVCREEKPFCFMSEINPRICIACYTDNDMDRFRPVKMLKTGKEPEDDRTKK
jgi:hypothetical protein